MSEKMGGFYYEVDIDTEKMLSGINRINAGVDSMEKHTDKASAAMDKAEKSASTLSTGLSKLASTIKVLISVAALKEMAGMVQKYQEMSERVQMATSSVSEFNEVQARLLKTANGTFRSLSEAQELYISTAASLRSMGYTTSQTIDVQDSMSYAFVKNATSADRAASAISAFSKSINTGKVSADQWETLTSAIPSVIDDIATASGKSGAAIRALGSAGKLTAQELTEGLKQSLEANMTAATGMSNNLTDATVRLRTAITEVLVSFENQTGAIQGFTNGLISAADSILDFSRDSDSMKSATDAAVVGFGALASVMAGKFASSAASAVSSQISGIKATYQGAAATRARAKEELTAASVTARRTAADKEAALSALNLATAEANVARGSAAEMLAMDNVNRTRAIYIQTASQAALADNAVAAAQAKVTATGITLSRTMSALRAVTAPLGGPIGIIAAVASGWYLYAQNQAAARKESIAFADTLPEVIAKLKQLNLEQLKGTRADTLLSIENQKEALEALGNEIAVLSNRYKDAKAAANSDSEWVRNDAVKEAANLEIQLAQKIRDRDSAENKLGDTQSAMRQINLQLNQSIVDQMKAARDNANATKEAEKNATFLGGAHALLAQRLGTSTQAIQAFNSESLKIKWGGTEGEKLLKQAERRLELSKLEGEARARLQAQYDAEDAGIKDDAGIKTIQNYYAETEKNISSQKKSNSESKKTAANAETVAQKLANLKQQSEQAAGSTTELSRAQAILSAQQSLGKSATAEQIKLAGEYAAAKWDVTNALRAQAVAEALLPEKQEGSRYQKQVADLKGALESKKVSQAEYNAAAERAEQEHQNNLAKIRSDAVVSPVQAAAATVDPVQQLANENARKLALIKQFEADKTLTEDQARALRTTSETQYKQQRIAAQWEIWRQQGLGYEAAAAAFDSFSGNASNALTGIVTGSMDVNDAMRSIGSTVLNSVINSFVQMGVEQAKAAIFGATTQNAAIATTTAAQLGGIATTTAASTTAAGTTLAAWLPAALVASVGSFGAAAIVGGAALVGAFALSKALGRKNGGSVKAGNLYEFGEGNLPEVMQMGGKSYMLPGNNGRVFSNKDVTSGDDGSPMIRKASTGLERLTQSSGSDRKPTGSQNGSIMVTVVIENNGTPQQVISQSTEKGMTGDDVIRIITQDANEKGPILQSIMANTSATARLR